MALKADWAAGNQYTHTAANDVAAALNQREYNVRQYGAVGDGTADDTSAVQAAIDAAATGNGGTVFFPQGTYKVSFLTLNSYVHLKGVGGSWVTGKGSIIKTASTSVDMLAYNGSATGLRSVTISDLRLEGPGSGTSNAIRVQNTGGAAKPNITLVFRNLRIYNFPGGAGIEVDNGIVSVVENVTAETCSTGFYLNGGTSTTMTACYAASCTTGYYLKSKFYCTLNSPAADDCGTAYLIESCGGIVVNGPGAEWSNPTTASPADGFKITGCDGVFINSPYTYQNKHYSWWITGNSYDVILVALFENTPVSATNSYKVDAGSTVTFLGLDVTTAGTSAGNSQFIGKVGVPSTATSVGAPGQWAADTSFYYLCVSANVWRRVAISSW